MVLFCSCPDFFETTAVRAMVLMLIYSMIYQIDWGLMIIIIIPTKHFLLGFFFFKHVLIESKAKSRKNFKFRKFEQFQAKSIFKPNLKL